MRGNQTSVLVAIGQFALDPIAKFWKANTASPGTIQRRFSAMREFARFLLGLVRKPKRVVPIFQTGPSSSNLYSDCREAIWMANPFGTGDTDYPGT